MNIEETLQAMEQQVQKLLVILEGPDGAGKSWLAANLQKHYLGLGRTVKVFHFAYNPELTSILPMFLPALEALDDHEVVIMDRSPLSEIVYSAVLREGRAIGAPWEWALWNMFSNLLSSPDLNVHRVILDADDALLRHRAYGRGEDFVPPSSFQAIVDYYRYIAGQLEQYGWMHAETTEDPTKEENA